MVLGAKRLGYGAKRLGLKIEAKRLGENVLGAKRLVTVQCESHCSVFVPLFLMAKMEQ